MYHSVMQTHRVIKCLSILSLILFFSPWLKAQNDWDTTTNGIIHYTNGNVGIGMTNPNNARLEVVQTANSEILRACGASGAFAFVVRGGTINTTHLRSGLTVGQNYFTTPPANGLIVEGNVGIGLTTPGAKLDVNGESIFRATGTFGVAANIRDTGGLNSMTIRAYIDRGEIVAQNNRDFAIKDNQNNVLFYGEYGGNVGIGTVAPGTKLEVSGDIRTSQGSGGDLTLFEANATRKNRFIAGADSIGAYINSTYSTGGSTSIRFLRAGLESMRITNNGYVGIGTNNPDELLTVKGTVHAQEVKVDLLGALAPDYVFAPDYELMSLQETENYIKANRHLPEVPSAAEIQEEGLHLKEMNLLLLKKVEELTLHTIRQEKQIKRLQKENTVMQQSAERTDQLALELAELRKELTSLKK